MKQESDKFAPQYGAAKERLFRVLLQPDGKERTWYQIAKEASASYGWAHPVLQDLTRRRLIDQGRVINPRGLFDEWASMPLRANTTDFQVQEPEKVFAATRLDYAWTTYFAESQIQRHLFPRRLDFYTSPRHWNAWRKLLAGKGLIGGGNVRILLADPHIVDTSRVVRGRRVVATPQLIVDLKREGGPCGEAAELLLEKEYGAR